VNWLTITAAILAIGVALLLFLIDDAFDKLWDRLFRFLGLQSGAGPLVAELTRQQEQTSILLINKGKKKIMLGAVEGINNDKEQQFPTPYLPEDEKNLTSKDEARKRFAKMNLLPGQSLLVILNSEELETLKCQELFILDRDGGRWCVQDIPEKARK
jgi:hypothetical protein